LRFLFGFTLTVLPLFFTLTLLLLNTLLILFALCRRELPLRFCTPCL
jgi:hypothetical protein